ncbi:patatin-like phospholipase family protein [Oryzibacter oryziterrae]|uniref:patatin-like phospholipase family protein n=1 Tax=Oryzibacter oryziterrae TaxID=2766474 RepID=UPI001F2A660F|nr:patatin-like phospholipase family protein [Oryzibacter oryziterrae]
MNPIIPASAFPRIGLALGGGGARGLAHVHVVEALDELGLKAAAVTGCSIGAIIGAGVAAGMSGAEVREHVLSVLGKPADVWARIWQLRPRNFSELISGIPLFDPEAVVTAFLPETIPAAFADLPIPFATVATDFYGTSELEITDGPVRRAVAASIALPAIFRPVEYDGLTLLDGGLVNPLPFDKLPEAIDLVVACDVVGTPVRPDKRSVPNAREALFGASQVLMQSLITEKLKSRHPDVLVRPPVSDIRVLDFMKAREILEATASVKDEVKRGIDAVLTGWDVEA